MLGNLGEQEGGHRPLYNINLNTEHRRARRSSGILVLILLSLKEISQERNKTTGVAHSLDHQTRQRMCVILLRRKIGGFRMAGK
eukprot:g66973.t1